MSKKLIRPNLYDALKILAIATMLVDHLGYFFFPEFKILRVIGRIAFPIFLFLVGFNHNFRLNFKLFKVGVVVYFFESIFRSFFNLPPGALNIILGIFAVRILLWLIFYSKIPWIQSKFLPIFRTFFAIILLFLGIIFAQPLRQIFDYGELLLIFGLFGAICRKRPQFFTFLVLPVMLYFVNFTLSIFPFSIFETLIFMIEILLIFGLLGMISKKNFPLRISSKSIQEAIVILSNYSLEIWAFHFMAFWLIFVILKF